MESREQIPPGLRKVLRLAISLLEKNWDLHRKKLLRALRMADYSTALIMYSGTYI